jgi:heme exporter protein A
MAVMGPNGAGKSTLLRVLAGLLRPAAGAVRISGQLLGRGTHEVRRGIGFLGHQSLLYDDLTLLENLAFSARLYALPEPLAAARQALQDAGLAARAHDTPRGLSRGAVQRAAIERAFIHDPVVLLLDEPFTGLDAAAAQHLRDQLRRRRDRGRAVLLVTHHPGEAWELASRIGILVDGRLLLDQARPDDLPELLRHYQSLAHG